MSMTRYVCRFHNLSVTIKKENWLRVTRQVETKIGLCNALHDLWTVPYVLERRKHSHVENEGCEERSSLEDRNFFEA